MNVEEIKMAILNLFRSEDNETIKNFLEEFCRHDNVFYLGEPKTYKPIYFSSQGLSVQVTRHEKTPDDSEHYDVIFDTSGIAPADAIEIDVGEPYISQASRTSRVSIRGGCVHFTQYASAYVLDEEYKISTDKNFPVNTLVFDIINKDLRSSVKDVDALLEELARAEQQIETPYIDWCVQIEEECANNFAFKKAAQECALTELLNPELKEKIGPHYFDSMFLPALYSYIKCPATSHLLNHEPVFSQYITFIVRRARQHRDLKESLELYFTKGATNICELLGIDAKWAPALSYDEESFSFFAVDSFKEVIENYSESLSINSADELKKVMDLTQLTFRDTPTIALGHLSYMLKRGYDLYTLHEYLSRVDAEQGISMPEGLTILFVIFKKEYALTGSYLPVYPKYLRVKEDVQEREYLKIVKASKTEKEEESLFIQRLRSAREELFGEFEGYRFVRHDESIDGRFDLNAYGHQGQDIVYVEKFLKRSKKMVSRNSIRLSGDNVIHLSGYRLSDGLRIAVKNWAKHHGLSTAVANGV